MEKALGIRNRAQGPEIDLAGPIVHKEVEIKSPYHGIGAMGL